MAAGIPRRGAAAARQRRLRGQEPFEEAGPYMCERPGSVLATVIGQQVAAAHVHEQLTALLDGYRCDLRVTHQMISGMVTLPSPPSARRSLR
ncbi:hypothetical protein GCM10010315_09860 [Streptomyces luteosporeus]|uniref:Uncharacterized protein n=1 Tax=Streptomyces luteosporeus TaxID=173856 RepID=A0ABP6G283_9ACTN